MLDNHIGSNGVMLTTTLYMLDNHTTYDKVTHTTTWPQYRVPRHQEQDEVHYIYNNMGIHGNKCS